MPAQLRGHYDYFFQFFSCRCRAIARVLSFCSFSSPPLHCLPRCFSLALFVENNIPVMSWYHARTPRSEAEGGVRPGESRHPVGEAQIHPDVITHKSTRRVTHDGSFDEVGSPGLFAFSRAIARKCTLESSASFMTRFVMRRSGIFCVYCRVNDKTLKGLHTESMVVIVCKGYMSHDPTDAVRVPVALLCVGGSGITALNLTSIHHTGSRSPPESGSPLEHRSEKKNNVFCFNVWEATYQHSKKTVSVPFIPPPPKYSSTPFVLFTQWGTTPTYDIRASRVVGVLCGTTSRPGGCGVGACAAGAAVSGGSAVLLVPSCRVIKCIVSFSWTH